MDWYEYMVKAAKNSRFNTAHWFRYLRKVIFEASTYLTAEDVQRLIESESLTNFQKVSLQQAVSIGSPTHDYIVALNKKSPLNNVRHLMEKYKHG